MKVTIGIDLGSTTSKAVVLDERERVVGRGITNSRSNYDAACGVARTEALNAVRLLRLTRAIAAQEEIADQARGLARSLDRAFRCEQYLAQLDRLEEEATRVVGLGRYAANPRVAGAVASIFAELRDDAPKLFGALARRRSDFFRDIAGSGYQHIAERESHPELLPFDLLLGVYDQAILAVESEPGDLSLEAMADAALRRAVQRRQDKDALEPPLRSAVRAAVAEDIEVVMEVGTGYGRARLPFPRECLRSEILCHGLGAHRMFPETRTVLDIGGQDTKAIQVDGRGIVTSFQMNDRCAAGCGRYLGYIADEMNLGLHELGPLALRSSRAVRINSTCTVFAGAELRDRLAMGQRREDILLGLHRAIILRAMSLIARSGGIDEQFTWTGGVANNTAAVRALRDLVAENYGAMTINIDPSSIYMGALGAALFAHRQAREASA